MMTVVQVYYAQAREDTAVNGYLLRNLLTDLTRW
jgi:hypothetical protein